jgi:hypothetical protein
MPGKLKILLGMFGINAVLGLVMMIMYEGGIMGIIMPLIWIALCMFVKNNVVRIVLLVLSVLGLVFGVLGALGLAAVLALGFGGGAIVLLLTVVWGLINNVYAVYALTRPEVKAHFGAAPAAPPAG